MFDGKAFGLEIAAMTKSFVERQLAPLRTELAEVKAELAAIKAAPPKDGRDGVDGAPGEKGDHGDRGADGAPGLNGKDGRDGVDGKDGSPGKDGAPGADGRDGTDGKSIAVDDVAPLLEEIVTRKVAEIPRPTDGKDGRDGVDGKDGVGLAGVLKDHEGCVVFTLTNGAIVKLGTFDGKDGEPGKDGAQGRDVDPELVRATIQEEVQKQITAPLADAYKGVWKPGAYKRGDAVTWAGSLFIAAADTEAKPENTDQWRLAVKRGRDGKDGEVPKPPPVVKL